MNPERVPTRTAIICITAFAIATEAMVFDWLKYDARKAIIEDAARTLYKRYNGPAKPEDSRWEPL